MSSVHNSNPAGSRTLIERQREHSHMRRLFFLVYPLCIAQAMVSRVAAMVSGRTTKSERSVLAEARSAADAAVGYAFHV